MDNPLIRKRFFVRLSSNEGRILHPKHQLSTGFSGLPSHPWSGGQKHSGTERHGPKAEAPMRLAFSP
jgi:hypothetical protein